MLATVANPDSEVVSALGNALKVATDAISVITDSKILMAMFACSLLVAGFKVFKRAKNAVK